MHYILGEAAGASAPTPDIVKDNPITVTVGIPGFNAQIPVISRERFWLALGLSLVVGVAGGIGLAKWLNRAQG